MATPRSYFSQTGCTWQPTAIEININEQIALSRYLPPWVLQSVSNIQEDCNQKKAVMASCSIINIVLVRIYLANSRDVQHKSLQLNSDVIDGSNYHKELHLDLPNGGSIEGYTIWENQKDKHSPP